MIRSLPKETPFWSAFGLWFSFFPVICNSGDWDRLGSGFEDRIFMFIAKRRTESQQWIVPDSDKDLLQGVGANGTPNPKSDSTFESLLFFSLEEDFS
jgi:hypothetical protein